MDAQELVKTEVQAVGKTDAVKKQGFFGWLKQMYSDDPNASSSRVLTHILGLIVAAVVVGVFLHVCHISDNAALGLWLAALPGIIVSLAGFINSPYLIRQGSGTLGDLMTLFTKKNQQ